MSGELKACIAELIRVADADIDGCLEQQEVAWLLNSVGCNHEQTTALMSQLSANNNVVHRLTGLLFIVPGAGWSRQQGCCGARFHLTAGCMNYLSIQKACNKQIQVAVGISVSQNTEVAKRDAFVKRMAAVPASPLSDFSGAQHHQVEHKLV